MHKVSIIPRGPALGVTMSLPKEDRLGYSRDWALDRIAMDQARAMAAKDTLSHEALGSFSSRITSNIREQKGYTYSPQGQLSNRYRDAYWVEIADVTTKVTGPALKEILGEIDRLQAAPPSEQELKGFQNYRAGVFILQNSSRPGIIGQLEFVDLHGLPADYLNGYVQRVYAVTPEQIQAIELISGKPVVAVTVNHEGLEARAIPDACASITRATGLPAFDVLVSSGAGLVEVLRRRLRR